MKQQPVTRFSGAVSLLILGLAAAGSYAEEIRPNVTGTFLGPASEWDATGIVIHQASPLFGSREFLVTGSGKIVVVYVGRNEEGEIYERRYELADQRDEAHAVIAEIRDVDALQSTRADSLCDLSNTTCGAAPLVMLRNALGEVRSLSIESRSALQKHVRILERLGPLIAKALERAPAYEGAYDPTFVPKDFAWAAQTLAPRKEIRWVASAERAQRASSEEAYEAKAELQREEVARKKAQEQELNEED